MSRRLWIGLAAVVVAGIAATAAVDHFRGKGFQKDIAKSELQQEKHEAQEEASAHVDSVVHTLRTSEKNHSAKADSIHAVADTAKQAAVTVRDSIEMWRTRDSLHVAETLQLRIAKDSADARADSAEANAKRWQIIAEGSNRINAQLRKDLAHSEQQCRILPFVPCPSRTVALVIGVAGGAYVATHVEQTKQLFALGR